MRLFVPLRVHGKNNVIILIFLKMDNLQKVEVQILNAFVDNEIGGNPAGVVLNADHLTNEQKLQVAAKVGLSETAFVSKSQVADY